MSYGRIKYLISQNFSLESSHIDVLGIVWYEQEFTYTVLKLIYSCIHFQCFLFLKDSFINCPSWSIIDPFTFFKGEPFLSAMCEKKIKKCSKMIEIPNNIKNTCRCKENLHQFLRTCGRDDISFQVLQAKKSKYKRRDVAVEETSILKANKHPWMLFNKLL